ncbi:MAG: deoxyribose-phosphate aldolase [Pseudomonadota bacterium]
MPTSSKTQVLSSVAALIDHTLLKPDARAAEIDQLCDEAISYGFAAVCVNGRWVKHVADRLAGNAPLPCSVVGFPLGASVPCAVADEARQAIADGAREIDMVMSIGDAIDGEWPAVASGIEAVYRECGSTPLKVILETCLLSNEQKKRACEICRDIGVAFVKTSTGFSTGGATTADVALMRSVVGSKLGVKASGGIRDFATAKAMLDAGANRLGCSAGVSIVSGATGENTGAY